MAVEIRMRSGACARRRFVFPAVVPPPDRDPGMRVAMPREHLARETAGMHPARAGPMR